MQMGHSGMAFALSAYAVTTFNSILVRLNHDFSAVSAREWQIPGVALADVVGVDVDGRPGGRCRGLAGGPRPHKAMPGPS